MAAGVPVDNDIGLFFRSFATPEWDEFETMPKVIAVTGSNGKSTTSALIHHVLQVAGRPTQLAGNIGRGVLDLDPPALPGGHQTENAGTAVACLRELGKDDRACAAAAVIRSI